jgi:drug/metabolite transporter (DMT)-like permease
MGALFVWPPIWQKGLPRNRKPFSLDSLVFSAVLLAAFLHAAWNVLVRMQADRLVSLTTLQGFMGFMGIGLLFLFGLPKPESYGFALASGILHTGYNLFLVRAYRAADLSQVYPIARGAAPLLTMVGSLLFLSDGVHIGVVAAIMLLVAGLVMAGWQKDRSSHPDPQAVLYALGTACFIAVYSMTDGLGARTSGDAFSYAGLLFVLDAVFLIAAGSYMRGPALALSLLPHWKQGIIGGTASGLAYAVVMWAMTKAPIASVAALRETSIVFVLFMSARMLRESLTAVRIVGALLITAGAILLRLA